MKIAVLCGGLSMERDVSLSSGTLICRALRARGHQAVLADVYMGFENGEDPAELFEHLPPIEDIRISRTEPDLDAVRKSRKWQHPSVIGRGIQELCSCADVAFLALHGACGEDGRIQAMLDLLGVPYTGSGFLGSALAMDKNLTKALLAPTGVRTPAWEVVSYRPEDSEAVVQRAEVPCVVKPVDGGSSIGVAIPKTKEELRRALEENAALGRVMLEQYISGRELDVGVLEDEALPSIEIIPRRGFYDYVSKYQPGETEEVCPANVDAPTEQRLRQAALAVHRRLGLRAYSRADFKLDDAGNLWFIEINTLPGMTPTSLMPQEAAAVGIDYETLCERIVELALEGRA